MSSAKFLVAATLIALVGLSAWLLSLSQPGKGQALFLGDSLTRRGDWDALLGPGLVANHGLDGDTSKGALRRLGGMLQPPPEKVFIMIGINELGQAGPDSPQVKNLLDNHLRMIRLLAERAPRARVFLLSLLPVRAKMLEGWIGNLTILEVNRRLAALAAENSHAYLDLHSRMVDQGGELDRRYTDDGLHLSPAGYRVWRDFIAPYL